MAIAERDEGHVGQKFFNGQGLYAKTAAFKEGVCSTIDPGRSIIIVSVCATSDLVDFSAIEEDNDLKTNGTCQY